jgi:hypothetical protein
MFTTSALKEVKKLKNKRKVETSHEFKKHPI